MDLTFTSALLISWEDKPLRNLTQAGFVYVYHIENKGSDLWKRKPNKLLN